MHYNKQTNVSIHGFLVISQHFGFLIREFVLILAVCVCSFPLTYGMATSETCYKDVHTKVGMEPSGQSIATLRLDFESTFPKYLRNDDPTQLDFRLNTHYTTF